MDGYGLNLPMTSSSTNPLHLLQSSSPPLNDAVHTTLFQPTAYFNSQQEHHQQQQQQAQQHQQQQINNNVSTTCSNLLTNTFAAVSTGRNIDFNTPCENSLRSWGSNVSLRSNTSSASSSPSTPNSTLNEEKGTMEGRVDCAVCEDKASGKHYGVMTCEGCKSFFKRSIRRSLQYVCRVNNTCSVDKHRRNQCQACRLNKCFRAGMKKDAVQRGRQTITPRYSPYSKSSSSNQINEASTSLISQFLSSTPSSPSPINDFNNTIGASSPPPSSTSFNNTKGVGYLLSIIQWAKSNSYFPSLSVNDQAALLKLSWKDLFVLSLVETSPSVPIQLGDIMREGSTMSDDETFSSYVSSLQRHINTLTSLQLDPAEFACLKALMLFTPDAPGLSDASHIQEIQTKVLCAMESYTRLKTSSSTPQQQPQPERSSKLLMVLTSLRTVNPVLLSQIFFAWSYGKTPMLDDVIQDMLLASYNPYNTHSHNHSTQDISAVVNTTSAATYHQQQYYQHCNINTTSM